MNINILKISVSLVLAFFIYGCGYQPLLTEKYQKFNVSNFTINGDKKLGQSLANNFSEVEGVKNNLIFIVIASKEKNISNRSSTGSPLEYNITISFSLKAVSQLNNKEILNQTFTQSSSYKASKVYLNTLNREKIIVDNITKSIAEQITNRINLIYN